MFNDPNELFSDNKAPVFNTTSVTYNRMPGESKEISISAHDPENKPLVYTTEDLSVLSNAGVISWSDSTTDNVTIDVSAADICGANSSITVHLNTLPGTYMDFTRHQKL